LALKPSDFCNDRVNFLLEIEKMIFDEKQNAIVVIV